MSDSISSVSGGERPSPSTAGAMLRQARQAQGLHIAALAAAIKVTPRKLELLESDQFDQLPDATFTRALAQTVCRALKIDPVPVLALLPLAAGQRLEDVGAGLNAPFRDRPGRMAPKEWPLLGNPVFWLAGLIVIAALVVYFMPSHWLSRQAREGFRFGGASAPAMSSESASAPATVSENVAMPMDGASSNAGSGTPVPAPAEVPAPSSGTQPNGGASTASPSSMSSTMAPSTTAPATLASTANAAANDAGGSVGNGAPTQAAATNPNGALQLRPSAQSWVEVTDARGAVLISRLIGPGEAIGLDGTPPFKLKIGNAGATQVSFRGRSIELAPYIRDNVARFDLK